jgi:hypothetical protein
MNGAIKLAAIMAIGLGVFAAQAVDAAESGVTVVRGTAGNAAATKAVTGLPTVLRGIKASSPRRAKAPRRGSRSAASGWIATGGDTLWLVERQGGRIIGCWLQGSTQAGQTDIRCGRGGWR